MARERTRKVATPLDTPDPRFEGSAWSNQECEFLIEHLGKPSVTAFAEFGEEDLPVGVNETAVEFLLDRTHTLALYEQQLQERSGDPSIKIWCGFAAMREVLSDTMKWRAIVQELKRRSKGQRGPVRMAAGAPSLHLWDRTTGQAIFGAAGADTDRVLTMLDEKGKRKELHVEIQQTGEGSIKTLAGISNFIAKASPAIDADIQAHTPEDLLYDEGDSYGTVTCPLCEKSETFTIGKTSGKGSKRLAVAAIARHLAEERTIKVDAHRLLAQRLRSGRAGASSNRVAVTVGA